MMQCECKDAQRGGWYYNQFVGKVFSECLYYPVDYIPLVCSLISTVFWMFALMPQVITNYKNKQTEALSPVFVVVWLAGDIFTLAGAIISQQPMTMILCGAYFCLNDVLMLSQSYIYRNNSSGGRRSSRSKSVATLCAMALMVGGTIAATSTSMSPSTTGRTLLSENTNYCDDKSDNEVRFILGSVISWIAGMLYFFSRIPQIRHMISSRSAEGLDVRMFILCVAANTFGGAQFIAKAALSNDFNVQKWCADTLPFVIGSTGTLVFDFIIITIYFRHGRLPTRDIEKQ